MVAGCLGDDGKIGLTAGYNAVEKFGNRVPPFDETQKYVRKVLKLYSQHSAGLSGDV